MRAGCLREIPMYTNGPRRIQMIETVTSDLGEKVEEEEGTSRQ